MPGPGTRGPSRPSRPTLGPLGRRRQLRPGPLAERPRLGAPPRLGGRGDLPRRAAPPPPDTSRLHGLVRGMLLEEAGTGARGAPAPDARPRLRRRWSGTGALVFVNRDRAAGRRGRRGRAGPRRRRRGRRSSAVRAPEAETGGPGPGRPPRARRRLRQRLGRGDLPRRRACRCVSRSALPLVLLREEGARSPSAGSPRPASPASGARFTLPPSRGHLGPGDVVRARRRALADRPDRGQRAPAPSRRRGSSPRPTCPSRGADPGAAPGRRRRRSPSRRCSSTCRS